MQGGAYDTSIECGDTGIDAAYLIAAIVGRFTHLLNERSTCLGITIYLNNN